MDRARPSRTRGAWGCKVLNAPPSLKVALKSQTPFTGSPNGIDVANRVFFDVTLTAMVQLMPISQIVYGTDFPYRTAADHTKGVTLMFTGDDLKAVDRENALRILPRLKTA